MSPGTHGKFLSKVWRVVHDGAGAARRADAEPLARAVARAVDDSTRLVESFRFNVAISRLHELTTALGRAVREGQPVREGLETLAILLAPVRAVHRRGLLVAAGS